MSALSEAPHQVKGEVSSAGYPHGELIATGRRASGFDFGPLSILPLPATLIQTNLAINTLGDEYDQEADQVSEKVMRMSEPRLQHKCACEGICADCQKEQSGEEHQRLQLKPVGTSGAGQTEAPPIVHDVLRSSGQPLDAAARAFMEPRFWPRLFPSTSALRRSCRAIVARRERSRLYRRPQCRVCRRSIRTEDSQGR